MDRSNEPENTRRNQGRVQEHEHNHEHDHGSCHDHDHGKMPVVLYFVGLALALIALFFNQNEICFLKEFYSLEIAFTL